ncbi:BTAD domain-containing putative transcriptional regulator [Promicromonospora sp. Populi]|uniref:BTAD domain-containing putative transcriptional regulator n=1 Tax=Promicromonospora sp. Populi TaxID=3239420 RepID=UPI0034E21047
MQIRMFGPFEVRLDDGIAVDLPGTRLRTLLVALALNPGRVVPKATLVDWIWGEHPPAEAANALQRLVSRLRKVLPDGAVEGQAAGYRLLVEPDDVDAVRFERLVGRAHGQEVAVRVRLLREALVLWRGAAMQDVEQEDGAAFRAAVTRLERLRLTAIEDRLDAEVSLGHGGELVPELTDLVAEHPVRERLVATLIRALAAAGRDSEALLVFQRTRENLAGALGVDPSPELSALHVALLRGELRRQDESPRTNVRAELTSFVGRDAGVVMVRELVTEHRLTTLVGPGGAGKTRLATEAARSLVGDLPDGAWLIELAAVGTAGGAAGDAAGGAAGDVAQAALTGLGLRDALLGEAQNVEPTDRVVAAVREREMLLILDNCEHVIESVAKFADRVLGECPRLRILATSREPIGITGEALWHVLPLALPGPDAGPAEIESAAAVRLLRDRAHAIRQDLAVDAGALATMARICRALDGMPLAIELAAARLRTMSLDQLAGGLDDRFRLLTGGSRTALPRHRTLRAMVDWSWELLSDAERTVLRRLSVFWGGASLEAAERVCVGDAVEQDQVLDLLTALTEKSLLVADGDGAPRYRLLGTIKEYATGRLAEAGESELARQAHLAWFTDLAETADPHLRRAEQVDWLAILDAEHDNIRAAMRGALAAGEASAAMRLAAYTGWYWWLSGQRGEGLELITAATELPGEVPDEIQAMVYGLVVHFMVSGLGDVNLVPDWIHRAYRHVERGPSGHPLLGFIVPLERMLTAPDEVASAWESLLEHEDPWARALTRLQLGKMRIMTGQDAQEADRYLEAALAEFRPLGERFGISFALSELAERLALRGELADACEHYEQAIAAVTAVGAADDVIRMRSRQAQLRWLLGDEEASVAAMAEAERCAEQVTWPGSLAILALAQAELARWRGYPEEATRHLSAATAWFGDTAEQPNIRALLDDLLGYLADDLDQARAHHDAACRLAAQTGQAPLTAQVLVGVADLALRRDRPEQAAQLLAASIAVRGLADQSRPDTARIEREARSRLGGEGFAAAARAGAGTSWDELVEVALTR